MCNYHGKVKEHETEEDYQRYMRKNEETRGRKIEYVQSVDNKTVMKQQQQQNLKICSSKTVLYILFRVSLRITKTKKGMVIS